MVEKWYLEIMAIYIKFVCDGCFKEQKQTQFLTGYNIIDHVPDEWIAFDSITNCTYCPDCIEEIENEFGEIFEKHY